MHEVFELLAACLTSFQLDRVSDLPIRSGKSVHHRVGSLVLTVDLGQVGRDVRRRDIQTFTDSQCGLF